MGLRSLDFTLITGSGQGVLPRLTLATPFGCSAKRSIGLKPRLTGSLPRTVDSTRTPRSISPLVEEHQRLCLEIVDVRLIRATTFGFDRTGTDALITPIPANALVTFHLIVTPALLPPGISFAIDIDMSAQRSRVLVGDKNPRPLCRRPDS